MSDPNKINLANISVVLVGTRYPENIGAAARAMRNMGIKKLILVDPQNPDPARIGKMATHAALEVVDRMTVCSTLKEALNEYSYVVGTTARLGGQRKVVSICATTGRIICRNYHIGRPATDILMSRAKPVTTAWPSSLSTDDSNQENR